MKLKKGKLRSEHVGSAKRSRWRKESHLHSNKLKVERGG
jgi:hypothetical protein